jgi:hypothetical protein
MSSIRTVLALASLMVAVACAARAADAKPAPQMQKHVVDAASIPGDHLLIDDLATLQAGDTRTYTTEGGQEVTVVAKENEQYALTVGDHTIVIGGEPERGLAGLPAGARVTVERHADADGKVTEQRKVMVGAPGEAATPSVDSGEAATVITIISDKDGKHDQRVIVLRAGEKKQPS